MNQKTELDLLIYLYELSTTMFENACHDKHSLPYGSRDQQHAQGKADALRVLLSCYGEAEYAKVLEQVKAKSAI